MSILLREPASYDTMEMETQSSAREGGGSVVAVSIPDEDLRVIRGLLISDAIEVQAVCSVQEAMSGSVAPPSAILLDADTNGSWRETLEQCLHRWPQSRVVLISRIADEQMWIDALKAGAHDLLLKPFHLKEFRSVVCSALSHWNERARCPERCS